jgi:hypothetical protein
MRIVGGLDVHRAQITFDYVDLRTGEEVRGMVRPATRTEFRSFLATLGGKKAAFALEATTGWRFVVEELEAAGMEAHLGEPADTIEGVVVASRAPAAGQETGQRQSLPTLEGGIVDDHRSGRFISHGLPPESMGLGGPEPYN